MSLRPYCVHDDGRRHPSDGTLPCPIVAALDEHYDPHDQDSWWEAWDRSDRDGRRRMERLLLGAGTKS